MINGITSNLSNSLYMKQESVGTHLSINNQSTSASKTDSFEISDSTKLVNQINKYEKQLDNIFGVPKQLDAKELKRAEQLEKEIDKILGVDNIKFSKSDQKLMEELDKQIDAIFKDDKVTKDEQKQLNSLIRRQDSIISQYEKKDLSAEDEKKVIALFKELDSLQGLKTPDEKELGQVKDIYSNLNEATKELYKLTSSSNTSFEGSAKLIKQQNSLIKQLNEILDTSKDLEKDKKEQVDNINKQLENIALQLKQA